MLINRNISFLLIFLISCLVLLPQTSGLGLSYDELASMTFATSSLFGGLLSDNTPPFYYLLLKFWFLFFPFTAESARAMNLVISAAFPIIGYFTARKFFGQKQALFAAFLFSFSAVHIRYTLEIRSYVLFEVVCALNLYFFLKSFEEKRIAVGYWLSFFVMLGTHYLAFFWFLAQAIVYAISKTKVKNRTWIYLISLFLGLFILTQLNHSSLQHLNINANDFQLVRERFFKNAINYLGMFLLIILIFLFRNFRYQNLDRLFFILVGVLVSAFLLIGKSPFLEKYFIFLIPILLFRLSDVLVQVDRKRFLAIVLLFLVINGGRIFLEFRKPHSAWSEIVQQDFIGEQTLFFIDERKPINRFYDLKGSTVKSISELHETELNGFDKILIVTRSPENIERSEITSKIMSRFKLFESKLAGLNSYEPLWIELYQRAEQ